MRSNEIFVFAGAGLSRSMPSNLPTFPEVRSAVLCAAGLDDFVGGDSRVGTARHTVASALLPEPFLSALHAAGVPVEGWLEDGLGRSSPNAAHRVVAALAGGGAKVWTVNFDHLIEDAAMSPLRVSAWPQSPAEEADVLKPHGTFGGPLVFTAEQVLSPLDLDWVNTLRHHVLGRAVLFVGYSGNDLDFRPIWNDVLATASTVHWFGFNDETDEDQHADVTRRRAMLRDVDAGGRLSFPPNRSTGTRPNPSYDFVRFCVDHGLVAMPDSEVESLLAPPSTFTWPTLDVIPRARTAMRLTLGDIRAARSELLRRSLTGPARRQSAADLARVTVDHGARPASTLLRIAELAAVPVGRLSSTRAQLHRKRVTILANRGRHRAVLRATRRAPRDGVSTELILRSATERYLVSLALAIETATEALHRAHAEHHSVRIAHAAYQRAQALVWAEDLDRARRCLADELVPYAPLAANRWVAWAEFLEAALLIRSDAGTVDIDRQISAQLDNARARFGAEALVDGLISVDTVRLTATRRTGAVDGFLERLDEVRKLIRAGTPQSWFYARRHPFSLEAVEFEAAEYWRVHRDDPRAAAATYKMLASSRFPLHQSLGELGCALTAEALSGPR